jgi:hypothetical protein
MRFTAPEQPSHVIPTLNSVVYIEKGSVKIALISREGEAYRHRVREKNIENLWERKATDYTNGQQSEALA